MRYDKKDRAKIVALAAILIVLWGFIGVRFALLSRAHKAQARARQQARDAARQTNRQSSTGPSSIRGRRPMRPTRRIVATGNETRQP